MLTYQELLSEIKRWSPSQQLALLEDLAHLVRENFATDNSASVSPDKLEDTAEELGCILATLKKPSAACKTTQLSAAHRANIRFEKNCYEGF